VVAEKLNTMDFYGHPTGIRSIAISSDDRLACTVSKNVTKIWNVASRTCIQSLSPAGKKAKGANSYGLCTAFLPGNTHVAVGTREGHLLLIDIAAGEVVYVEEGAHEGAIWSLDIRRPSSTDSSVTVVTGSADKSVKFWSIESQEEGDDDDDAQAGQPMFVHTRTLQMTDDVISVRYSHSLDPTKRMVFVSTLDCTIKVFFDDSLKMFLSLYGHKLPALAVDCSDDDVLLASAGADKTIKIWGLDFGDTHRTLHGHGDSVTDVRFVRRTHNFFTASKDGTVHYWDGDRFEQILLLNGHCAEVNCLAISRTGAFVLSGGMDRQVRVWERTKDIVFLEEERERELEQIFDRVNNRDEGGTARILDRKRGEDDNDDNDDVKDDEPQSEAAVRRSMQSVCSGDNIMEALERADQELKDIVVFRRAHGADKKRSPNLMMLGLEPAPYILWVLRNIKSAEIEQSLIVLSLRHTERLMYYLIVLLKGGQGVELCSRVAVFLVKAHQNHVRMFDFCFYVRMRFLHAMKIRFTCQTTSTATGIVANKNSIPKFLSMNDDGRDFLRVTDSI
jgi:U3 small nucleolar RNA-associated protein 12